MTLFQDPTKEETLEAKHEHEHALHVNNHSVQAYRVENSRSNEKLCVEDCALSNQKLVFCGVGVHHQNGI